MNLSKYIGIPHKIRGREWDGLDCWGLVHMFYKTELGIELPNYSDLYDEPRDEKQVSSLVDVEKRTFECISKPEPFAIMLMSFRQLTCHIGIVIDENHFLHSLDGHESAIERLDSPTWKHRIRGFYRTRNLSGQPV